MKDFGDDIKKSLRALRSGGVILYPTDTIWGLGCDATNEAAVQKIFRMKHRDPKKSMIILVAAIDTIFQYVSDPSPILLREMQSAVSPTTAIFQGAKNLPDSLIGNDGSIAVRVPSDEFCSYLLREFAKPLVSTSANISAKAPPKSFSGIDPSLIDAVDYAVNYRREDESEREPSRIIRMNEDGAVERIR